MASAKVILRTNKKKKDGSHPLVLRIIKDRKVRNVFLGTYLQANEWDADASKVKKNHPNSARINNLILKKLALSDDLMLEASANSKELSALQIKKVLKRDGKAVSFFSLAEDRHADYIRIGNINVANGDSSRIKNFRAFLKGEDISFPEINESLLRKFEIYLKTLPDKKKHSQRSIVNHFILIRTLYNKAIKDGIVDRKNYPFGKDKIKIKIPESIKIGLDEGEVKCIYDLKIQEGTGLFHAKNKWLFSFNFAGMRISDVLFAKWSDFIDGRLHYRMGKNQKIVSVKVPEKLLEILKYYEKDKRSHDDFIFPDMKTANLKDKKDVYRKINTAEKNTNDHLKTIAKLIKTDKKITNHIARHTFGNIAGDKISPQMLQKLYRHTDIRTTMGYQANFIHKSADDALDSVVNF